MRWRSCSAAVALLAMAACLSSSQRSFLPDPSAARLNPDDWRTRASALLETECPRLLGNERSALGEVGFELILASGGMVREAILTRPSGDERIDAMFGGLAAQLVFTTATSDGDRAQVTGGYSCAPNAAVATLELNTRP
ncbi:MAG TPA: hypothetical protein VK922_09505 [Gemmatimonadaceae bacterium]|nr:hypothetical protein [Gemmatimonadaceae bacterium]